MITVQQRLDREISAGKSIGWWAIGYYVANGGPFGFTIKVPIFGITRLDSITDKPLCPVVKVLIDYLGSMMWINVEYRWVNHGSGGNNSPSSQGKLLRYQLESIKNEKGK